MADNRRISDLARVSAAELTNGLMFAVMTEAGVSRQALFEDVVPVVDIRRYGAVPNDIAQAATNRAALQTALASLGGSPGTVHLDGFYYVAGGSAPALTFASARQHLVGSGKQTSVLSFVPTAHDQVLIRLAATVTTDAGYQNALAGFGFRSLDTTYRKVAVDVLDQSELTLTDLAIGPSGGWTDTSHASVGLRIRGRDLASVSRVQSFADIPISIEPNPRLASIGLDHWHFSDLYLGASGTNPCVRVLSGVVLTNNVWDGYQAWTGGSDGFRMLDTTAMVGHLSNTFKNIRWEQGGPGYIIDLESTAQGIYNTRIENCAGGNGAAHNGFKFRNVRGVTLDHCFYSGTAVALDADTTCSRIRFAQFWTQIGGTLSTGGLAQIQAVRQPQSFFSATESDALWDDATDLQNQPVVIDHGAGTWSKVMTLDPGGTFVDLPMNGNGGVGVVRMVARGATVAEGGEWIIQLASSFVKLLAGSANCADTDTASKLCLVPNGDRPKIVANFAESVEVLITATWRP